MRYKINGYRVGLDLLKSTINNRNKKFISFSYLGDVVSRNHAYACACACVRVCLCARAVGSKIHILKSYPSVPQGVTMFGNRTFKEAIKLTEVIRVGPHPIRLVSF